MTDISQEVVEEFNIPTEKTSEFNQIFEEEISQVFEEETNQVVGEEDNVPIEKNSDEEEEEEEEVLESKIKEPEIEPLRKKTPREKFEFSFKNLKRVNTEIDDSITEIMFHHGEVFSPTPSEQEEDSNPDYTSLSKTESCFSMEKSKFSTNIIEHNIIQSKDSKYTVKTRNSHK
jgi:hypothetical protein